MQSGLSWVLIELIAKPRLRTSITEAREREGGRMGGGLRLISNQLAGFSRLDGMGKRQITRLCELCVSAANNRSFIIKFRLQIPGACFMNPVVEIRKHEPVIIYSYRSNAQLHLEHP